MSQREKIHVSLIASTLFAIGYGVRILYLHSPVVFVLGSVCLLTTFGLAYYVARDLRERKEPIGSFSFTLPMSRNAQGIATMFEYDEPTQTLIIYHVRKKTQPVREWGMNGKKETGGTIEQEVKIHSRLTNIPPHRADAIREQVFRENITDSNEITKLVHR